MLVGAGGRAGVGEQHQRQRARHLVVVGQRAVHLAGEPDRLFGQRDVDQRRARGAGVALGEDEVADVEHRRDPSGQLFVRGHDKPGAGLTQLCAGPGEALGHGARRHQVGGRDLLHRQSGDGPQRQRHLRRPAQRGMAAQDQQTQRVVAVSAAVRPGPAAGTSSAAGASPVCRAASCSSRRVRARSARKRSISRRDATRINHARGSAGTPSTGHCAAAASAASCAASSQSPEIAVAAQQRGQDVRRLLAPHVGQHRHWSGPPGNHHRPQLDGLPGPGELADDLLGPLPALDVDQEEPGQVLLRLRVGPVDGERGRRRASGRASRRPGRRAPRRRPARRWPASR